MKQDLIRKYIRGEASIPEKEIVLRWINEKSEHKKEFLALRKLYDLSLWNIPETSAPSHSHKFRQSLSIFKNVLKIAAIVLLTLGVNRYFFPPEEEVSHTQTLEVPAGQRAYLTLSDGSSVWLNAKTTLTFPDRFDSKTRKVKLNGEAYFQVSHNEQHPFIVETEHYDVKVLGTEFNVMAYQGSPIFETSLLSGCVEVKELNQPETVRLKPNEKVFLQNGKLKKATFTHENNFLWKNGIIYFDNLPFPEIIQKLQLYYDISIKIENPTLSDFRCTGKFWTKDGIEHVLRVLQLKKGFTYIKDEEHHVITIK